MDAFEIQNSPIIFPLISGRHSGRVSVQILSYAPCLRFAQKVPIGLFCFLKPSLAKRLSTSVSLSGCISLPEPGPCHFHALNVSMYKGWVTSSIPLKAQAWRMPSKSLLFPWQEVVSNPVLEKTEFGKKHWGTRLCDTNGIFWGRYVSRYEKYCICVKPKWFYPW